MTVKFPASIQGWDVWRGPFVTVAGVGAAPLHREFADYVCDGTADDVQINAAIAALPAGGGKVVLSEGTFTLAAGISIPTSTKLHLVGAGRLKTLITLANGVNGDVIAAAGALGESEFEHFNINGNKANQTTGHGINCSFMASARFYNVDVRSCKVDGFGKSEVANANGLVFIACEASSNDGRGWGMGTSYAARLWGCAATQNGGDGFRFSGDDNTCSDCIADTNTGDGFQVDNGSRNGIYGCWAGTNGGWGVNEGSGANNNKFIGNRFTANTAGPITITGASSIASDNGPTLADPGNAGAIPVASGSAVIPLVTAGAETRTLAAPTSIGQELTLYCKTFVGNCVVTCATTINEAGNNTITFTATGQAVRLFAVEEGSTLRWRGAAADGAALSTV